MSATISGIHHVTAITADAQRNIDFYTGTLGLRLLKLTVNYDDPGSYHLYYGDERGRPGTVLTFFAWPDAFRGKVGPPQVTVTAFSAPAGSMEFWSKRLAERGVAIASQGERFGESVIAFSDPDGMQLEIVGSNDTTGEPWTRGGVPKEHAIRGFHSITISEEGYEKTAELLTEFMGFQAANTAQNRFRYRASDAFASIIDVVCVPARHAEIFARGIVHHVAFGTADDDQQRQWREQLAKVGFNVSPIMDRRYFRSIYYREPGGVLFEIATDAPGFTADETLEHLGTRLMLPPWMEKHRAEIMQVLPPVTLPGSQSN